MTLRDRKRGGNENPRHFATGNGVGNGNHGIAGSETSWETVPTLLREWSLSWKWIPRGFRPSNLPGNTILLPVEA